MVLKVRALENPIFFEDTVLSEVEAGAAVTFYRSLTVRGHVGRGVCSNRLGLEFISGAAAG